MRRVKPFFFFLLLSALFPAVFAQTNIPGGLVSGTWTAAGSPYLVQGNIMVANGTLLTIQPGVTVNFQGSYRMLVNGRLVATGTDADSIRFTATNTTSGWQGIRFDNTASTNDSSLLDHCSIEYSIVNGINGAGLYVRNFSKLRITNNTISNCWVVGVRGGGGIYVEGSTILISRNKLFRNHAVSGGGILVSGGSPLITENIISYNDNDQPESEGPGPGSGGDDPDSYGGGISIWAANAATIADNTITYNKCLNGGGLHLDAISVLITNNIINYNQAANGGAIYESGGGVFTANIIDSNIGLMAGGIYCSGGGSLFRNNKITNNVAAKAGGGIMLSGGSATIINNLVANNSVIGPLDANYQGGGGFSITGGDTSRLISGNVVVNNTANNGGAFMFYTGLAKLENNTVVNNSAVKGGAIFCHSSVSPVLVNTILWNNTASVAGQQIFLNDDACDPSIRYSDIMGGEAGIDANGNFYTGNYQNNISSDPLFMAPSAGSGAVFDGTTADWSLVNNSPAIDAGMPGGTYPATDYAGNLRVVSGMIDIGAIEAQVSIPPTATVSGGGKVCPGAALPSVRFTFTPGTFPLTLVYSVSGVQQPPVTGINTLEYTITNAAPGMYAVVSISDPLSTGSGSGQATVQIEQPVADFMINSSTQCLTGNNFVFTDASAVNSGAVITNWLWLFGDGTTATTAFASHTYASAGIYSVWLVVTSSTGCKDTITKNISTVAFGINTLQDTVRTSNDSVILNAGTGYLHYQWNTGDTTRTIVVKLSGKYKVTVTNGMGCTASDSCYVDLRKLKTLIIGNQQNLCTVSSFILPVRTKNITNVIGLQGTIRWNQLMVDLDSVTFSGAAVNITAANVNLANKANGYLTYSWNDNTLTGKTVADSTNLFTMWFTKASGSAATTQPVSFSSNPTALEIDSINLSNNTPVIVTETAYVNGSAQFRSSAGTSTLQLADCDSVVYNNIAYYANTLVYDTIKYTGLPCDSLIKAVNIIIFDTTIHPTISISANAINIINGTAVTFTANYTYGGNTPSLQWFKNNIAIPGETSSVYVTNTLSGRDTIHAVLRSSLSCATDSMFTSNRIGILVRYNISGNIRGPQGATTRQPSVAFTGVSNVTTTATTSGFYSSLLYGGPAHNYVVKPFKTNDVNRTNGVSTLDIAIIQSHILSSTRFTSPYQWVAADVNRSRSVTSLDILLIQRLILGVTSGFGTNGVWTFVDTANGSFNPLAPLQYRDTIVLNELHTDITNLNFTAVKLGDVNFDYNNNVARPLPSAAKPVVFYYDNIAVGTQRKIKVPVRVRDFKNVLGMQFTLGFDVSALQFAGIENNRLNMQFATTHAADGKLTFLWNDANNNLATLSDGDVLLELLFNVVNTIAEEDIEINSDITEAELWDGAYTKHAIIKGTGKISKQQAGAIDFTDESFDVSPNPSNGQVQVTFRSLSNKNIAIRIQTTEGRILHTQMLSVAKGVNIARLDTKAITAAGIYYLHTTGLDKEQAVKKLVIIK